MATFGTLPGVKVTTTGGAVSGVTIGRAQYLVLIGNGDNSAGSASFNEPVQINSRSDADAKFGADTDIARAYRGALANGANRNFIYGVMAENSDSTESFSSNSSGTLANAPIVDEADRVSAQDTSESATVTVNFVYDASVSAPSDANTINLNPITGDWTADESSSYDITYDYPNWSSAISAAEDAVSEEEFGLLVPLSNAESVTSTLSTSLSNMRSEYKMALGLMAAEPNATTNDNKPEYNAGSYTDTTDDDAVFLVAPTTKADADESVLGAVGGLFAGNDLANPVYNDPLTGTGDLSQTLSKSEADDLRDDQVIPLRQLGSVTVRDSLSTSTSDDWVRDYFRRRIVDVAVVTAKAIAEDIIGLINDEDTRNTAETLIRAELLDMVDDDLLQPNTDEDDNLFVDVFEVDSDTVGVDLGISPYGVVKRVEIDLTINT